ncbi:hypothetical protein [Methanolobus vulcani]|jgi:hypothetical protein|uniref:hypothetical protein n=1 Tax=Methanolobus vulcani TaxID=38026 RepID=UPI0012B899D4|nr:hypothetical protein [Methanolobus vulcani]
MTGNICPLLNSECIKSECKWFISDAGECAVVSLTNNLWMVTYPQFGGGSLKVVDG